MRELNHKFAAHGHLLATLLLVGTLILGTAAGLDLLRGYLSDPTEAAAPAGSKLCQADSDNGSDSGEGMLPTKSKDAEPSGNCILSGVSNSDNTSSRSRIEKRHQAEFDIVSRPDQATRAVATSSSQIDSRLGRQFTLVGAHPSGTS